VSFVVIESELTAGILGKTDTRGGTDRSAYLAVALFFITNLFSLYRLSA